MAAPSLAEDLQRSIMRSAALGIIVISLLIATIGIVPLYYKLKVEQEQNLALVATTHARAIEEYLVRSYEITAQITSRTQIREALVAYNQGQINQETLVAFSQPKLADALATASNIVGMIRFDQNAIPVITLGQPIPTDRWTALDLTASTIKKYDPILINNTLYLLVSAPIWHQAVQVGTDVILFDLTDFVQMLEDQVSANTSMKISVGRWHTDQVDLFFPLPTEGDNIHSIPRDSRLGQAFLRGAQATSGLIVPHFGSGETDILAYNPISNSDWVIVTSVSATELYALVYRQIILLLTLTLTLVGGGTLGVMRLLRPIAGKLVLHADELERQITNQTITLRLELDERQRAEAMLHTVNQALRTLRACNQVLLHATEETILLQQTCSVICDIGGYQLAWVGVAHPDEPESIVPIAQAGHDDYLQATKMTCAGTEHGHNPIAYTLRTGQTRIVHTMQTDPACTCYQAEATRCGIAAVIVLPLIAAEHIFAALAIYSAIPDTFVPAEVGLLTELANDLSYGIIALRTRVERQHALEALTQLKQRNELILKAAGEGIYGIDVQGFTIFVNPAMMRMTRYAEEELIGQPIHALLHHTRVDGTPYLEETCPICATARNGCVSHRDTDIFWRKDGTFFPVEYMSTPMIEKGVLIGAVVTFQDISERKAAEQQLRYQALSDALTQLPNRTLFLDLLTQAMQHARYNQDYRFAVLFLDLDNFRMVNDSLGHLEGDQLLIIIARRLQTCVRATDTIARFGGDEFTILLNDIDTINDAIVVAETVQRKLAVPIQINSHEISTSVSIGIALSNSDYEYPSDMLRDADTALQKARIFGRNYYCIFDTEMHASMLERLHIEAALRRVLERQELRVYYQPIVDLRNSQIVGFEALIRWQHPQRGLLFPGEFLPIAEETKLALPIGWWVISEACRQLHSWQRIFPAIRPLTISVNLSATALACGDVVERFRQILDTTGLAADSLKLEITEGVMMDNAETTITTLTRLRHLGIQLCIDDFGTGYSSLRYLHRFPIQTLKIDRSFVSTLGTDADSTFITQSIVTLSHTLGIEVVAEGIETVAHLAYLQSLHCEYGQGFFFARAVDPIQAEALLKAGVIQPDTWPDGVLLNKV